MLQFGPLNSGKLYRDFATAARHIMHFNGATYAEHYLDDYIIMGTASSEEYHSNLEIMTHMQRFGFLPQSRKNVCT